MANYNCVSRTNYFEVTDEEKLKELVRKIGAELFEETEGKKNVFGFGSYGPITSYWDEKEYVDIEIFDELQAILPEGEMVVIQEVGYEKLRYLTGVSILVTKDKIETVDLSQKTEEKLKELGYTKELRITY